MTNSGRFFMRIIDLHCDTVLFCFEGNHTSLDFDGHINTKKRKAISRVISVICNKKGLSEKGK